jgi:hypothetical protein
MTLVARRQPSRTATRQTALARSKTPNLRTRRCGSELDLGIPGPWKKPLPYLCGFLALEAGLATSVVVGFLALAHDHGLATQALPVASSYVPVTLAWGPLVAVVGVGVLTAVLSITAAWSTFCLTRRVPRKVGRVLRNSLCAAVVGSPLCSSQVCSTSVSASQTEWSP